MFSYENDANFVQDREDLIAILRMRFGDIPSGVVEAVYELNELDTLERLILVAANAPSLKVFLEELEEGNGSFRIMGERFNPIEALSERDGINGEKGK
ncbi:hypothetical protein LG329_18290 [Virgibacillus necropolis]|uniref:hypothetical protein n=1 Tax=Virgibacillus necropolis TaxID=163877 RepID=UPI00384B6A2D